MNTKEEIQLQLIEKISELFKVPAAKLSPQTRFNADLHLNSFRAVELIADIEDYFNIEIPDEKIAHLYTIEDLATAVFAAKK